jgi:hypothetical protein
MIINASVVFFFGEIVSYFHMHVLELISIVLKRGSKIYFILLTLSSLPFFNEVLKAILIFLYNSL